MMHRTHRTGGRELQFLKKRTIRDREGLLPEFGGVVRGGYPGGFHRRHPPERPRTPREHPVDRLRENPADPHQHGHFRVHRIGPARIGHLHGPRPGADAPLERADGEALALDLEPLHPGGSGHPRPRPHPEPRIRRMDLAGGHRHPGGIRAHVLQPVPDGETS